MKKEKELSAGILFIRDNDIFLARATYSKPERWDIPKGHVEPGETPIEAAVRECSEETGHVLIDRHNLIDLGKFKYSSNKDLYLFMYTGVDMPDPLMCSCISMFEMYGKIFPETDKWAWISIDKVHHYIGKSLQKVLAQIL